MTIKQLVTCLTLAILFAGAGCTSPTTPSATPTSSPTAADAPAPSPTAEPSTAPEAVPTTSDTPLPTTSYDSAALGLSFSYPTAWGPVGETEDKEWTSDAAMHAAPNDPNCLYQQLATFGGVSGDTATFLVEGTTQSCEPPGRDGYFGDEANKLRSWNDVLTWCKEQHDDCDTFTNPQGVQIAHSHIATYDYWGTAYEDLDEYAFIRNDANSVVISNERLLTNGLGRQEAAMRALVDSISFRAIAK